MYDNWSLVEIPPQLFEATAGSDPITVQWGEGTEIIREGNFEISSREEGSEISCLHGQIMVRWCGYRKATIRLINDQKAEIQLAKN
jgi:hypothetical protein